MEKFIFWYSIATESGLSLFSVGRPGLRTEVDESVFTGGMTAIQSLLGTEIGAESDRYVGGSEASKFGRFVIKHGSDRVAVAQFLVVSTDGSSKVPDHFVSFSEELITTFSKTILASEKWEKMQKSLQVLDITECIPEFLTAVEKARSKIRLSTDQKLVEMKFDSIITPFMGIDAENQYSRTIESISERKFTKRRLTPLENIFHVKKNHKELLQQFSDETLGEVILINPEPVIHYPKLKNIRTDLYRRLEQLVNDVKPHIDESLQVIRKQLFEEGLIREIVNSFPLMNIQESQTQLKAAIEAEFAKKIAQRSPFLLLAKPDLSGSKQTFKSVMNEVIHEIVLDYDLSIIFGRLAEKMLEGKPSAFPTGEFLRTFFVQFRGGLSKQGWEYISAIFAILSKSSNTKLESIIKKLDISQEHRKALEKSIVKLKVPKDFNKFALNVENAETAITFYDALYESIFFGAQVLFDTLIYQCGGGKYGVFIKEYALTLEQTVKDLQTIFPLIKTLNFLENRKWDILEPKRLLNSFNLFQEVIKQPNLEKEAQRVATLQKYWKPEVILSYFQRSMEKSLEEQCKERQKSLEGIAKKFSDIADKVVNYLNKPIPSMSKIYTIPEFTAPKTPVTGKDHFPHDLIVSFYQKCEVNVRSLGDIVKQGHSAAELVRNRKKPDNHYHKIREGKIKDITRLKDKVRRDLQNVKKRILDQRTVLIRRLSRDIERSKREVDRIFTGTPFPGIRTFVERNGYRLPQAGRILAETNELVASKLKFDSIVFKDDEVVLNYAGIDIFNKLPRQTKQKALGYAIYSPRDSDIVSMALQEEKNLFTKGKRVDFEKRLKTKIEDISRSKFTMILLTIGEKMQKSFFTENLQIYPTKEDGKTYGCLDLGPINATLFAVNGRKILSEQVIFKKVSDNRTHVYLKIIEIKKDFKPQSALQLIGRVAWEKAMDDFEAFLEIMRFSAALISPMREKKFNDFLQLIFSILTLG